MMEFFEKNKHMGVLVLRLFLGLGFVVAALDKILGMAGAKGMFEMLFGASLGAPMLYLAIAIELCGGLALLFGWHVREFALLLSGLILVAFVVTFQLGAYPNMVAMLREVMVMNTGGGNTAVNWAYFAGLLSLAFSAKK